MSGPLLSGVVVHWHATEDLAALLAAWPRDPHFELLIVDNSGEAPQAEGVLTLHPERNLGFAGAANLGIRAARAPWVLLLNPDARPEPGALEAVLAGIAAYPDAAGLAPRLLSPGASAEPQWSWQLRPLPRLGDLLAQVLFLPLPRGPEREPDAGAPIAQPAAAALALRRDAVLAIDGLDERFFPAWFEDVDLLRRLHDAGGVVRYWPSAVFRHGLGGSVGRLGYGRFLWLYDRNLLRYLRKHHGAAAAAFGRALVVPAALARLLALPLRRPRRAASRAAAARGLLGLAAGALSGWRLPRSWAQGGDPAAAPLGDGASL